jgi:hypothetical protein
MATRLVCAAFAAAAIGVAFSTAPANAASALFCHSIGQHLSNAHCCPSGQEYNGSDQYGGCCPEGWGWAAPSTGGPGQCVKPTAGMGIGIGIDDPRTGVRTSPCKALHTC